MRFSTFLLGLLAWCLVACDAEDNQAPTLLWTKFNGKEASIQFFVPSDTLIFEARFQDNYNLSFFRLKIMQHPAIPDGLYAPKVFLLDTMFRIGGTDATVYKRFRLDSSLVASGTYTLEISYADQAGNSGMPQERNFSVKNTCPRLELSQPAFADRFFSVGKKILFQGLAEDSDDGLDSLHIGCWKKTIDKNKKVVYGDKPVWQAGKGKIGTNLFLFEYSFTYEKTDTLEMRVWVRDKTVYPNRKRGKEMMIRKEMIFTK